MKTFLTALFFTLTVITSFAQVKPETSDHLTFKGIPIDGPLNEYISKMKNGGFTHIVTESGVAMLKGDFAAYKNCFVGVSTLKQKDLVSKITVIFPEQDTWSSLSSNYFSLKELLTEKYGEPSESLEEFQSSLKQIDDNQKMYEVIFDRCKYYTTYKTDKGSIQLIIDHDG
ncbi:MAG: hypothetical protein ACD_77C00339G0001, partial [uncultured bacterium]